MKRQHTNKNRTETVLSVIITSALVLTLAITVASAINRGKTEEGPNIVDLNETNGWDEAQNMTEEVQTPDITLNQGDKTADNTLTKADESSDTHVLLNEDATSSDNENKDNEAGEAAGDDETSENVTSEAKENQVAVNASDSVKSNLSFSENSTLYWPVNGEVILKYNTDNTIWFPTLEVYKCNPAIYISCETGTPVKASCTGVIENIYENEETGKTVVVSVGNGYTVTYGQLDNLTVTKGDIIKTGETIGSIAEPGIYYTKEGSGLYYQVKLNETPCDPSLFLK